MYISFMPVISYIIVFFIFSYTYMSLPFSAEGILRYPLLLEKLVSCACSYNNIIHLYNFYMNTHSQGRLGGGPQLVGKVSPFI